MISPLARLEHIELTVDSARAIASSALGLNEFSRQAAFPKQVNFVTAIVPIKGDGSEFGVGFAVDEQGCHLLAAALMDPDGTLDLEPLPESDVLDALGEIANLMAGQVKLRLHQRGIAARLGTPVTLVDQPIVDDAENRQVASCQIGKINVELLFLYNPKLEPVKV